MTTVTVSFPMPADNEATESPYWLIIDPEQMMKPDVEHVADMVTGPFFSRSEAQEHLEARRHAFSKRAVVYCHSGYASYRYKQAWRDAWQSQREERRECPGACASDDESACAACLARGGV